MRPKFEHEKHPLTVLLCFNIYQISSTCPLLWDVLGFPGTNQYLPLGAQVYFNRSDVKLDINAPQSPWYEAVELHGTLGCLEICRPQGFI